MDSNQNLEAIVEQGFFVEMGYCDQSLIDSIFSVTKTRLEDRLSSLGDKEIGIGSAAGYEEICQRSEGRWDVPIDLNEFSIDYKDFPWWPLVTKILGSDALPCFQGVVSSAPKTPAQEWHIDSPHLSKEHLPAHIITILIPLENTDLEMGPTEVAIGTHKATNHLKNTKLISDELVYQCSKTSPKTLMSDEYKDEFQTWTSAMPAGTCIVFDDRLLHRGQANNSEKFRHVAYFSYKRNGYDHNTYFESSKSLDK